jgi:two-component system, NarL family, sensor histidine kinase LiaS
MRPLSWIKNVPLLLRQLKWQLTLTYVLVSFTTVFIAAWWAIIAVALYLARVYPELNWQEALPNIVLPALQDILPSAPLLILPALLVSAFFGFLSARWLDRRLTGLRNATSAWQQGDFSVRVTDESVDEIGRFGAELNKMATELHALLQTRQELATLEERNRLARDLHDAVKQHMAAAALQIGAAEALLSQNPAAAAASLVEAGNLIHMAQRELGSIIFELQPAQLSQHGFAEALRQYTENWSRQFGIAADVHITGARPLAPETEGALFRLAQEALSNVARHSRADVVQLELHYSEEELTISIQDNGQGFDLAAKPTGGFGLQNMRQRVGALGGEVEFTSAPGQGTTLIARVPRHRRGYNE